MNLAEAIAAMEAGKKLTHYHFDSKEWVTIENGKILLEDGVRCSQIEFWKWRTDKSWNEGWELFEPIDTTAHLCNKHGQLDEAGAYAEDDIY